MEIGTRFCQRSNGKGQRNLLFLINKEKNNAHSRFGHIFDYFFAFSFWVFRPKLKIPKR